VNPARKMESKPSPLVFQFFLAIVRIELQTHYALYLGEDNGAIYKKITVAMGVGDITMPFTYEDNSSNEPMR
jgi:hypothetical protein